MREEAARRPSAGARQVPSPPYPQSQVSSSSLPSFSEAGLSATATATGYVSPYAFTPHSVSASPYISASPYTVASPAAMRSGAQTPALSGAGGSKKGPKLASLCKQAIERHGMLIDVSVNEPGFRLTVSLNEPGAKPAAVVVGMLVEPEKDITLKPVVLCLRLELKEGGERYWRLLERLAVRAMLAHAADIGAGAVYAAPSGAKESVREGVQQFKRCGFREVLTVPSSSGPLKSKVEGRNELERLVLLYAEMISVDREKKHGMIDENKTEEVITLLHADVGELQMALVGG